MIFPKLHISIERWKWNEKYGVYVSTEGNVRGKYKKPLKILVAPNGYLKVRTKEGLQSVHRLVLITFRSIDNEDGMTVDHLNHNKRDNRISNLEWVTGKENQKRANNDLIVDESVSFNDFINDKESVKKEIRNKLDSNQTCYVSYIVPNIGEKKGTLEEMAEYILKTRNPNSINNMNFGQVLGGLKNRIKNITGSYCGYQFRYIDE